MIGSVLFEGRIMPSPVLPRYYAFKMLLITMPLIGVAGMLCSLFSYRRSVDAIKWKLLLLHLFIAIPLLGIIVRGSVFYDGVRHLLFLVAFLSLSAAIGIEWLIFRASTKRVVKILAGVGSLLLAFSPLGFMVRNHPFEYTYYNKTVGGLKGAYGYYETDYYNYSVKQAYEWLLVHEADAIRRSTDSLKLASGCYNQLYYNYTQSRPSRLRLVDENFATQNRAEWDYGIFISRYLDGPAIQNGYWPAQAKVIYQVKADGVPLCVVLKNDQQQFGYKAYRAKISRNYGAATIYARMAVQQYPNDLEIWSDMARCYLMLNKLDSARWASDAALALSGDNNVSVYYAGEIAFRQGDVPRALTVYSNFLKRYPHLAMTWLGLAQAQALAGDLHAARRSFWKGVLINMEDRYRMYRVLETIAGKCGLPDQARTFAALAEAHYEP